MTTHAGTLGSNNTFEFEYGVFVVKYMGCEGELRFLCSVDLKGFFGVFWRGGGGSSLNF